MNIDYFIVFDVVADVDVMPQEGVGYIAQGLLTDCQQLDDWFWMTDSLVTDWNSLLTPCLGCSSCQDNVSSTLRSAVALAMFFLPQNLSTICFSFDFTRNNKDGIGPEQ